MRVCHTTRQQTLRSIVRRGVLRSYSQGRRRVVWVHDEWRTPWAFLHVVRRHGGKVQDVVTLTVDVPDDWLIESGHEGLYYVRHDILPDQLVTIRSFRAVSQSPVDPRDAGEG